MRLGLDRDAGDREAGTNWRSPGDLRAALWQCGGAALLAVVLVWLVRQALIDDAYITLAYARNLATNGHWGLILAEPANAATSPLNVLLLGGATAVLRLGGGTDPVWAFGAVFVGSAVALAWGWSRIAAVLRFHPVVPLLGVTIVLLNPFLLSASGLEVTLIAAVLVGLLAAAVAGQPVAFGIVAGLAVLVRLDLAVFVLPVALASPGVRRHWAKAAGTGVAIALPWFAWSWWFLGSAIPDTFAIKTVQRSFGRWTFANGLQLYYERDALATAVTVVPAVLGLAAAIGFAAIGILRRTTARSDLAPAVALGAAGAGYYAVYVLLGVPPYQWYYVPSFVALATCLCALAGGALRGNRVLRGAVAVPALVVVACLVAGNVAADVRGGVPWRVPPVFGNWATAREYERAGRELGDRIGVATVVSPGEIGTLAYFCQCAIVDAFADRGSALPLIERRIAEAGPVAGALLRLNYLRLDRDRQPRRAEYRLDWMPGAAPPEEGWPTSSPAKGVGHLRLIPITVLPPPPNQALPLPPPPSTG